MFFYSLFHLSFSHNEANENVQNNDSNTNTKNEFP